MRVDDRRVVPSREIGNRAAKPGPEPGRTIEGDDLDAARVELTRPRTRLVETTDHHGNLILQSASQFHHQTFGAPRIQTEHDLEDPRSSHNV